MVLAQWLSVEGSLLVNDDGGMFSYLQYCHKVNTCYFPYVFFSEPVFANGATIELRKNASEVHTVLITSVNDPCPSVGSVFLYIYANGGSIR